MDDATMQTLSERRLSGAPRVMRRPFLFVGLECARPSAGSARYALFDADEVRIGRGASRAASRSIVERTRVLSITVPDGRISQAHARIVACGDGYTLEDLGSRNGTKLNGTDVQRANLHDGDIVQVGHTFLILRTELAAPDGFGSDLDGETLSVRPVEMRTVDPSHQAELETFARVARSDATILVRGETGSGKELLARAAHRLGRSAGPFVAVNCGAVPAALVESQFFGHVKGAFSGALRDEPGFVRAAAGGTLFLDEVAELPRVSQAALLRVLQEREVVPVGGTRPVPVDVRVVSATHAPLELLVARGEFREDLLARLAAFVFQVPPLRERRADIGLIVAELLRQIAPERARAIRIDPDAGFALLACEWPRNVRELEQGLEVAVTLATSDRIELSHLPASVTAPGAAHGVRPAAEGTGEGEDSAALRRELALELERHGGNVAAAARAMGRARPLVHRWIKRFRLDPNVFRRKQS